MSGPASPAAASPPVSLHRPRRQRHKRFSTICSQKDCSQKDCSQQDLAECTPPQERGKPQAPETSYRSSRRTAGAALPTCPIATVGYTCSGRSPRTKAHKGRPAGRLAVGCRHPAGTNAISPRRHPNPLHALPHHPVVHNRDGVAHDDPERLEQPGGLLQGRSGARSVSTVQSLDSTNTCWIDGRGAGRTSSGRCLCSGNRGSPGKWGVLS